MSTATPAPRREVRTPFPVERVRADGQPPCFFGYGANVSETGLFVQSSNPREVGSELRLRLSLPGGLGKDPILVEIDAAVVWLRHCCGRGQPPAGMGLRLQRIELAQAAALQEFCTGSNVASADPIRIGLTGAARRAAGALRYRIWARTPTSDTPRQFWVLAADLASAGELARDGVGPEWEFSQVERCAD